MRLQAEGAPDPLHRADRQATVARHAARTPVCRIVRLALQRAGDHRFDALIAHRAWRPGARLVAQSLHPLVKKAAAPLANRHGMHTKLMADRLVLQPLGTRQDDPGALGHRLGGLRPGRQRRQFRSPGVRQHQCFQPSSRHVCLPPQWQKASQVAPNQTKCRERSSDMTNFWFRTLVLPCGSRDPLAPHGDVSAMRSGIAPVLLATKTRPPRIPNGAIERPRLLALADSVKEKTLTIVKAAAGYGRKGFA